MSGVGAESRPLEARIVGGFLDSAASEPSALLIEGEPGIGKTTLWLAAHELARDRGFRVLSARAAAAESVLAYTALADLLDGVPAAAWAGLPEPQRSAVDQVLLRTDNGSATDQRAVAAAFLSVVEYLADEGPLLVAVDRPVEHTCGGVRGEAALRTGRNPWHCAYRCRQRHRRRLAANAATRCSEPNSVESAGHS
jgi:hypothetical protein